MSYTYLHRKMEIHEDDDFVDDRFESFHDEMDIEEDEENARSKKVKNIATTTTTTSKRGTDDLEILDSHGRPQKRLPLIEKYRPATLDDVVAQDDIVQTITRLMEKNALPHLLLYGPPGTGKTLSLIHI